MPPKAMSSESEFQTASYAALDGTYVASGSTESPFRAHKVFDKNKDTFWTSGGFVYGNFGDNSVPPTIVDGASRNGAWLQIQLPRAGVVKSYTITGSYSLYDQELPSNWTLAGSDDEGQTWSAVDSRAGERFLSFVPRTFETPDNTREFSWYRLLIPKTMGGVNVFVSEWQLDMDFLV